MSVYAGNVIFSKIIFLLVKFSWCGASYFPNVIDIEILLDCSLDLTNRWSIFIMGICSLEKKIQKEIWDWLKIRFNYYEGGINRYVLWGKG